MLLEALYPFSHLEYKTFQLLLLCTERKKEEEQIERVFLKAKAPFRDNSKRKSDVGPFGIALLLVEAKQQARNKAGGLDEYEADI